MKKEVPWKEICHKLNVAFSIVRCCLKIFFLLVGQYKVPRQPCVSNLLYVSDLLVSFFLWRDDENELEELAR